MNSLAVALANQLFRLGIPRREAFRRAWNAVRRSEFETRVTGVTFGQRQETLRFLSRRPPGNVRYFLVREAGNRFDPNAVAVFAEVAGQYPRKIGYLPRNLAAVLAGLLDRGFEVRVAGGGVVGGWHEGTSCGVRLKVEFAGAGTRRTAA